MPFALPPKAAEYFDSEATAVLSTLVALPGSAQPRRVQLESDPSTLARIRASDISTFELIAIGSPLGVETQVYFSTGTEWVGLDAEGYPRYHKLVTHLSARKELKSAVSDGLVMNALLEWLKGRRNGQLDDSKSFTGHVLAKADAMVRPCRLYVPIDHLRLERDWMVAGVTFGILDEARISALQQASQPVDTGLLPAHVEAFAKLRARHLDRSVAIIEVEADRQKAAEIALSRTETALVALRFFSPTAFVPEFPCYVGVLGRVLVPSHQMLIESPSGLSHVNRSDERRMIDWSLGPNIVDEPSLGRVGALLVKPARTELEEACASAIAVFDRGVTAESISDRIVFTLTAAEVLLLRDSREPIQGLLAFRLAHLAGATAAERPGIVEHVKTCYGMRSRYIHHGKSEHEVATVRDLINEVRMAILHVVTLCDRLSTKAALIKALEDQMLASSAPLA